MARHLIVGDGTAYGVTAGLVDDGAVSVQKMSSSGPTELVLGDTPANAPQIRIISGGTDGKDIVTPWIYGKDIIDWSGKSYVAPVSQSTTLVFTGAATNDAYVDTTVKFVNTSNGLESDYKSYTVRTSDVFLPAAIAGIGEQYTKAMKASYDPVNLAGGGAALTTTLSDELPWFVKSVAWDNTNTMTFVGWDKGETMQNGQVAEYPTTFKIVLENFDAVTNGGTAAVTYGTSALIGYGGAYDLKDFEDSLMGTSHGYYNRLELPNAPTNQVSTNNTYDVYNLVATKDGSSASQIHGVDNLIEITIGLKPGDADSLVVENKLNAYLAGSFPNVIL